MASAIDHSPRACELILIIEDEPIVLAGYQLLFESWGYKVIAAASLEDGLAALRRSARPPDFILADYRLRDSATGTMAIEAVRRHFNASIPAALITGDTAVDRLRDAAASGLPILHKPVNGSQLLDLMRRTLNKAPHGLGA